MQAHRDGRARQRQGDREFQVEERIMHRDHDVGPNAQFREKHQERYRRCRKQRQRQHETDRMGAVRIVGGQSANELIGVHSHPSLILASLILAAASP